MAFVGTGAAALGLYVIRKLILELMPGTEEDRFSYLTYRGAMRFIRQNGEYRRVMWHLFYFFFYTLFFLTLVTSVILLFVIEY